MLAAVTLHDAMQLVRLSKPRSGAKYSLISYFFADNRSLSDLNVICKFELSPLEICHATPLERINSRTAFAAFTNGGAAAIIITQNTTASQAKC